MQSRLKHLQSRLKNSISTFTIPHQNRVWRVARLKIWILELKTSPPLTGVSRALWARFAEKVSKISPSASGPLTLKSLQKVSRTVQEVSRESPESVWRVFLDCPRGFGDSSGSGVRRRQEKFSVDFFGISGPEGARDPCKGQAGSQSCREISNFFNLWALIGLLCYSELRAVIVLRLATGKWGCTEIRVYPTECGKQFGRVPSKIGSTSLVLKSFWVERNVFGTRPASLPRTLGYACTFYAPTSPPPIRCVFAQAFCSQKSFREITLNYAKGGSKRGSTWGPTLKFYCRPKAQEKQHFGKLHFYCRRFFPGNTLSGTKTLRFIKTLAFAI